MRNRIVEEEEGRRKKKRWAHVYMAVQCIWRFEHWLDVDIFDHGLTYVVYEQYRIYSVYVNMSMSTELDLLGSQTGLLIIKCTIVEFCYVPGFLLIDKF